MMKKSRNPSTVHQPLAPYVHQIEISGPQRWLFLSGQVGMELDGTLPEDPVKQLENALANQYLRQNSEIKGLSVVKLCSPQTQQPQKAHDEHFSTFTMHTANNFGNRCKTFEPDHPSDVEHDRSSNHAGAVPLGRERMQLSNSAAIIQCLHSLVGSLE
jgi:hypothetical protein